MFVLITVEIDINKFSISVID